MKDLNQFAKDNQKFLKLGDGESFRGFFVGYTIGISRFDPEKEVVNYKLKYEDGEKTIFWGSSRSDVASIFAKIKPGTLIKITRAGSDKSNTSYKITPINEALGSFTPSDEEVPF